jgi:hypothetical protein
MRQYAYARRFARSYRRLGEISMMPIRNATAVQQAGRGKAKGMDMAWQNIALGMAGVIGGGVAIVHGVLVQRFMVRPFDALALADGSMGGSTRRLIPLLLQFSTFAWLLGGVALIAAANWFEQQARLTTSLLVGSLYLFGAVANLWARRGRHPGWVLMAAALVLILLGANKPGL